MQQWAGSGDQARCGGRGDEINARHPTQRRDADERRAGGVALRRPWRHGCPDRCTGTRGRSGIAARGTGLAAGQARPHAHPDPVDPPRSARQRRPPHQALASKRAARQFPFRNPAINP